MKAPSAKRLFIFAFAMLVGSLRAEVASLPERAAEFQIVIRGEEADKLRSAITALREQTPHAFAALPLYVACPPAADFCGARFLKTEGFSLCTQLLKNARVELTIRIEQAMAMDMFSKFLSSRKLPAQIIEGTDGKRAAIDFAVGPMNLRCEAPLIDAETIASEGAFCSLSIESPRALVESNFVLN